MKGRCYVFVIIQQLRPHVERHAVLLPGVEASVILKINCKLLVAIVSWYLSAKERLCHVLPPGQDRHPLSLVDCGSVAGGCCRCVAVCSTGQPGSAIRRLCQPRLRIAAGHRCADTKIAFEPDNCSGDFYQPALHSGRPAFCPGDSAGSYGPEQLVRCCADRVVYR